MLVPFRNPTPAHDSDVPSVRRQLAVVVPTTSAIAAGSSFSRFKLPRGAFIASFDAKSTRGFNSSSPSMSQGFGNDWLFWGTTDLEFFTYLLQSAINLDKIIFYPYHPREFKGEKSEGKNEVRKHARQLAKRLPPGVKSVVL